MRFCTMAFIVVLFTSFMASPLMGAAIDVDIAISSQSGWWGQAAADREMAKIVDNVEGKVNDIKIFPAAEQDALADWVESHTDNNHLDIVILCGQFPDTIYAPGNGEADDSIAELFLDSGDMFINTGDYMFYVVNAAGTNGEGGLRTMMDLNTTMWDDDTPIAVTEDGEKYLPSLKDYVTDRPFHLNELVDPWEAEIVFGGSATRAEPCVVHNTETDGRIGIFYQTASQDNDPRGEVMSEFILNWLPTIVGGSAVEPDGKLGTLWGQLKVSN